MPLELARAADDISFGLPASVGEYLLSENMERDELDGKAFCPFSNATIDIPVMIIWGTQDTVFDEIFINLVSEISQ